MTIGKTQIGRKSGWSTGHCATVNKQVLNLPVAIRIVISRSFLLLCQNQKLAVVWL